MENNQHFDIEWLPIGQGLLAKQMSGHIFAEVQQSCALKSNKNHLKLCFMMKMYKIETKKASLILNNLI